MKLPWPTQIRGGAYWRRRWVGLFGIGLAGLGLWWVIPFCYPLPAALLEPRVPSAQYVVRDGSPLRLLLDEAGQRSTADLPFEKLPGSLMQATLAVEDQRFYQHAGIDYIALGRATLSNLQQRRVVSGASTLAQQLVKISTPRSTRRGLGVKWYEAQTARRLLRTWSRHQVLTAYLSRVSYGNLFIGCEMAAAGYFNKPLSDLTLAESALLAGLPQAPTRLNPFKNPEAAKKRQRHVLTRLLEDGVIDQDAHDRAVQQPLLYTAFRGGFEAPHATTLLGAQTPPTDRGRIRTTLDASLQRRVEQVLAARLAPLRDRHVTQAAAVILENATGDVLALAGSRDFFSADGGQINGAWTPHSPGSALKPFTYLLALERGLSPVTVLPDLPVSFPTPTGVYRPENYDHRLYGPVTFRTALGNSLNIPAVRLLDQIGGTATLVEGLQSLGLTTLTEPPEHYGLGLTIGNAPVRLLELANAYACLARLGEYRPWRLLADAALETARGVCSPQNAFLIADMLSDNQARLLTFGAHSPLRMPFRVAVKTGTSSSYRDNWTFGYTPEFTVGVWVGNFDRTPMQGVSGVTGAAPILRDLFLALCETSTLTWFEPPQGLVQVRIDPRTGRRITAQAPAARLSRTEWVAAAQLPPAAAASDYDEAGRAYLPPEFAAWLDSRDNWLADLVVIAKDSSESPPLRINQPVEGSVYHLDPDLPNQGRRLPLRSSWDSSRPLVWTSPTLQMEKDQQGWTALLVEGEHVIHCHREAAEPALVSVRIHVVQD